jgi:hypothetical protein
VRSPKRLPRSVVWIARSLRRSEGGEVMAQS